MSAQPQEEPISVGMAYSTMPELVAALSAAGRHFRITDEIMKSPCIYMLVCPGESGNPCCARILGMYSQRDGRYYVKRYDTQHSCIAGHAEGAAIHELQKTRYIGKRFGEITAEFAALGFQLGYAEIYNLHAILFGHAGQENTSNSTYRSPRNKDDRRFEDALRQFEIEFRALNPTWITGMSDREFFFKQSSYSSFLRNIPELKIYQRPGGYLILGLLYDPYNVPVVQSLLLSDAPLSMALGSFVARNEYNFYIIDLDTNVITTLKERGISFFIKTRSVCAYIESGPSGESLSFPCFHDCNYGETPYLDLDPSYYLRRFCSAALFSANNMPISDIPYITESILALPFVDCLSALIWLIADDLNTRRAAVHEYSENLLPEYITDFLEDAANAAPFVNIDWQKPAMPQSPRIGNMADAVGMASPAMQVGGAMGSSLHTGGLSLFTLPTYSSPRQMAPLSSLFSASSFTGMPFSTPPTVSPKQQERTTDFAMWPEQCVCPCGKYQEFLIPCIHVVKKLKLLGIDPYYYVSSIYSKENIYRLKPLVPVVDVKPMRMESVPTDNISTDFNSEALIDI